MTSTTRTGRRASARTRRAILSLSAALVLALAACSDAGQTEAAGTETEPLATEIETEAPEPTEPVATAPAVTAPDVATEPTDAGTEGDTGTDTGAGGDTAAMSGDDIAAALQGAGLTTVAAAVQASGLGDELAALPSFTVFAPSDDAFTSLGADVLTMDTAELQDTLAYHVTEERLLTSDLADETRVDTLQGSPLTITAEGGTVTVGDEGATVTQADIELGDRGVVHVIDQVLTPGG